MVAGRALRRHGLLLTPEEIREPQVLAAAAREADTVGKRLATFKVAVVDAEAHERVAAAVPSRLAFGAKATAEATRIERALREGPGALSSDERLRLLSSPQAMAKVRAEVIAHRAHPAWWQAAQPAHAAEPPRTVREVQGALAESL